MSRFRDLDPIVIGYFSANIGKPQNPCSQQVADLMTEFGMIDLLHHLLQCWRYRYMKTRTRERQGRAIQSSSNYILGMDCHRFEMIGIRAVRNNL